MKSSVAVAVQALTTAAVASPWGRPSVNPSEHTYGGLGHSGHSSGHSSHPWGYPNNVAGSSTFGLKKFTSLVAFGDSYTDDSRLGYFINNNGSAPPVGYPNPANYAAADGGRPWPQYVAQYSGANVYNYAVSGAVCSNDITPRYFSAIDAPFPSVDQYEVPAYIADSEYYLPNGTKFLIDPPDQTVYSIFIGTNDLGNDAFITDSQQPNKTLVDYTDCVFEQLERVYENGGRYFVIQNNAPLYLNPQYGLPSAGGLNATQYWPNKGDNVTEISYKMKEYVSSTNAIFKYEMPYLVEVAKRFPGAHFAIMDINGLLTDIYNNPSDYLNGTAPLNVTGYVNHCNTSGQACVANESPDSFLWYDELHPSEQTDRVIARTFIDVVKGMSKWATYWSC